MGSSNAPLIMTLVNSIIGVSILAMPFCYNQCGILLASLILIFSNLMTRLSCHYLLKSATMTRRRTFELLAFHALGPAGKTVVELSIILLMIGTCIAFFVVMGDLSPPIIGSLLELKITTALRPAVLLGIAFFVVLPLGLLRNVDSLSSICTASFLFYLFLVFKVFTDCTNNLFSGLWINEVHFWRPAGILQCLPIFSMALSCQTQLLEIFDSVPNCSLDRMNSIVKSAVNLCTALYISVGFFGYLGYYKQSFSGNLLMSFSESYFSQFIKLGFVLSVAVTFPLVIFPCRASLHSLLFKKAHVPHYELVTGGGNHIPEAQFKCMTFFIITASLIVGLLAPNIEIVLGLLGSTIGVIICFLCPPILFICISSKATTEKVFAQFLFALGLFIMFMGTYANLYLSEPVNDVELQNLKPIEQELNELPLLKPDPSKIYPSIGEKDNNIAPQPVTQTVNKPSVGKADDSRQAKALVFDEGQPKEDKRIEPPVPQAPFNSKETADHQAVVNHVKNEGVKPPVRQAPLSSNSKEMVQQTLVKEENQRIEPPAPVDPVAVKGAENGGSVAVAFSELQPPAPPSLSKISKKSSGSSPNRLEKEAPPPPPPLPAKNNLSIGETRLLNEQKEVLQRMRGAKNEDKLAIRGVDNEYEAKKDQTVVEKRAPQTLVKEGGNVNAPAAAAAKIAMQRVQEKPPLPLLKREMPDNLAADREKRDLYFVTDASSEANPLFAEKKVDSGTKSNEKLAPVEVERRKKTDAAEKIAPPVDSNPTCEKDDDNAKASAESKIGSKVSLHDEKLIAAASQTVEIEKSQSTPKKMVQVVPAKDNSRENTSFHSIKQSASSKIAEDDKTDGMVIAPSKLSDPVVRLPEKIPIDDKLKPALLNAMKPMSRELKTVEDKPETNNKKK